MIDDIIKIEGKHGYTLFPKSPIILGTEGNKFGIVSWLISTILEGEETLEIDRNNSVVVTGNYEEEISPNKTYTILAKEVEHEKYGKQYQLIFFGEILDLKNVGNQKGFLRTFLTEPQIEEMFKVLDNPLNTIQSHDIESLKKVHGVGEYISKRIIERFEEGKDYCNVYLELDGLGLTPNFIQKLIKKYNNPNTIVKLVKENPYQLSFDIEGIGFKTADKIALNNGMSPTSKERVKGFINYLLTELGENGNSYITAGELTAYIFDEFDGKENILEVYYDENDNVTGTNIASALADMQEKNILIVEDTIPKNQRRVYLKKYWELENEIAIQLKRLSESDNKFKYEDWESVVDTQEQKQGWKFTEEQRKGIKVGLDNQVCFITGGAGSGKSSLVSGILESLKEYSFAQTALSGKASARLQEVTGKEGYTIHRLLGFQPPNLFMFNEDNQLIQDIIILDEISLVGGEIFLSLIKAIPDGTKLIILGDMGQLESIGCMNLAQDLYKSEFITTIELTKIHRQAQKSGIIVASKSIREGLGVFDKKFTGELTVGELEDMHFKVSDTKDDTRPIAIKAFKKYWEGNLINDIMDIQILSPVKERGDSSVLKLNLDVQEYINPPKFSKQEVKISYDKDKFFFLREGDKIMNIRNNYKLCNTKYTETWVFNGWTGILESIDDFDETAIIYFPIINDRVVFPFADLKKNVILGYVSTIHKFQGSSSKVIIGVFDYSTPPTMRTRELLYTLLTRAETDCTLVCQNKAVTDAIATSGVSNKNTFLNEMLN